MLVDLLPRNIFCPKYSKIVHTIIKSVQKIEDLLIARLRFAQKLIILGILFQLFPRRTHSLTPHPIRVSFSLERKKV